MPRAHAFRQADLTRAVKAVRAAGERVRRVVIAPTGEIEMELHSGSGREEDVGRPNDFDREFG